MYEVITLARREVFDNYDEAIKFMQDHYKESPMLRKVEEEND